MVNAVKLEIAIQIIAEKIAAIYNLIDNAKSNEELKMLHNDLCVAYDLRDRVNFGEVKAINEVLAMNKKKVGETK